MPSPNLQGSPVSEVLLGAVLRAVWWYQPQLRPLLPEGATSRLQALLCSVSYQGSSELWETVTFRTMQWTSFSLTCEKTGELFGSCCSPLTQSNSRCTVILWVTLRICMYYSPVKIGENTIPWLLFQQGNMKLRPAFAILGEYDKLKSYLQLKT